MERNEESFFHTTNTFIQLQLRERGPGTTYAMPHQGMDVNRRYFGHYISFIK